MVGPPGEVDEVLVDPLAVRQPVGVLLLNGVVGHDVAGLEINQEHLSGLQTGLGHNVLVGEVGEDANLQNKHVKKKRALRNSGKREGGREGNDYLVNWLTVGLLVGWYISCYNSS